MKGTFYIFKPLLPLETCLGSSPTLPTKDIEAHGNIDLSAQCSGKQTSLIETSTTISR